LLKKREARNLGLGSYYNLTRYKGDWNQKDRNHCWRRYITSTNFEPRIIKQGGFWKRILRKTFFCVWSN